MGVFDTWTEWAKPQAERAQGPADWPNYTTAPLVTNPCAHELASPRRLFPASELRTQARTGKNNLELQMNDYLTKVGV
jgi:hypothetical protein